MAMMLDVTKVKIPSLPKAAMKIIELVQDPDVDVPVLGKTIELDSALAARIVRLANSSLFGLTREIVSVPQALVILGLRSVKLAALSFTLIDSLHLKGNSRALSLCWKRILTNAMANRLISGLFKIDSEEAFLGGLMQDVGMLLCATANECKEKYAEIIIAQEDESSPPLELVESETLGFTHNEISTKLLAEWRLPQKLIDGIEAHVDIDLTQALAEGRKDFPTLLAMGDAVTSFLLKPSPENLDRFMAVSDSFGESSSDVDRFVQQLEVQVREFAELLNMELPAGKSYEDVLKAARDLTENIQVESRDQLPVRVRSELARARSEKKPLSLLLLRVPMISMLAKQSRTEDAESAHHAFAILLQRNAKPGDAIFRLNLSSFCFLANEMSRDESDELIKRIIAGAQEVAAESIAPSSSQQTIFGVVCFSGNPEVEISVETMLLTANENLAQAVAKGEPVITTVF